MISTIALEIEMKHWLEGVAEQNNMTFSEAIHHHLTMGRQLAENKPHPTELSKSQKLLIQCAMETLLIVKASLLSTPEDDKVITQRAKHIISKTLGTKENAACPSS